MARGLRVAVGEALPLVVPGLICTMLSHFDVGVKTAVGGGVLLLVRSVAFPGRCETVPLRKIPGVNKRITETWMVLMRDLVV